MNFKNVLIIYFLAFFLASNSPSSEGFLVTSPDKRSQPLQEIYEKLTAESAAGHIFEVVLFSEFESQKLLRAFKVDSTYEIRLLTMDLKRGVSSRSSKVFTSDEFKIFNELLLIALECTINEEFSPLGGDIYEYNFDLGKKMRAISKSPMSARIRNFERCIDNLIEYIEKNDEQSYLDARIEAEMLSAEFTLKGLIH